jgi:hypothetical protein
MEATADDLHHLFDVSIAAELADGFAQPPPEELTSRT